MQKGRFRLFAGGRVRRYLLKIAPAVRFSRGGFLENFTRELFRNASAMLRMRILRRTYSPLYARHNPYINTRIH